jgi:hypothetical protein
LIEQFKEFPYYAQFTFESIAASTSNQREILIPHNMAVYGIAISAKNLPEDNYFEYRLQFQNYMTGDVLFDEPIFGLNIASGCVAAIPSPNMVTGWHGGAFVLPSKWWLQKNQKIVCSLNTLAGSTTETYWVTLLGYTCDYDPNPGIQPFVYAFPMSMGMQDNIEGGQTSVPFGQQIVNTVAKPMIHDFELNTIVLNPYATEGPDGSFGTIPRFALQISWPGHKLFDRFVIDGVAGGGLLYSQLGNVFLGSGGNFGFPTSNVIQYRLARKELIPKGTMVRVDISPAPTYLASSDVHVAFNEEVCMALIGNHIA